MSAAIVLCAIEATEVGAHIYQVAKQVARERDAKLHVINVVEPAVYAYADLGFAPLAECTADWIGELMKANRQFLTELVSQDDVQYDVVEGNPAREIVRTAEQDNAVLVVMGLHNRRGLQRLVGSTTHRVLNHIDCDVLAVHPDAESKGYDRILVAVDTSEHTSKVLESASAYIAEKKHIKILSVQIPLSAIFVTPMGGSGLDWSFTELTKDLSQQIQMKVTRVVRESGMNPDDIELKCGEPRDVIVESAKAFAAELIVVGSHNRNLFDRVALGSTSRGVLDATPCDVLVCKQHAVG